jgi:hypothetical protein
MPKTPTGPKAKHAPTTKESKDASKQLRKGHSSAGRAMAAKSKGMGKRR